MHYRIGLILMITIVLQSCTWWENRNNPYMDQEITFSEHIGPIIHKNCTPCHRPGEAGPFQLITYRNVAKRAKMVKFVTETRFMPPWPADRNYTHFLDEWGLTDDEIMMIGAWVAQGASQGDKDKILYPPVYAEGSMLGMPDLTIKMPIPYHIVGNNTDQFIIAKFPYELERDTFVSAIEFAPDNRRLLHHVNGHVVHYDEGKKSNLNGGKYIVKYDRSLPQHLLYMELDILNDDGTYPYLTSSIVNYLPGSVNTQYPDGIGGIKLKKKGFILFKDIHYGPSPIDDIDQSSVNIFFTDKPPVRPVREILLGTLGATKVDPPLLIPPNTIKTFKTVWKVPYDISVLTVNPHMHLLGKSMKAFAIDTAGDTIRLIHIPERNFRWQFFYTFPYMVKIPKESTLYVYATFDNTEDNPENPFHPPRLIRERNGSMGTTDEMFQFIITYLPYEQGDEKKSLDPKTEANP